MEVGIGGLIRYLVADKVEWGESYGYRVTVGPLFGKFVGFIITENIFVRTNFLDHDFMC